MDSSGGTAQKILTPRVEKKKYKPYLDVEWRIVHCFQLAVTVYWNFHKAMLLIFLPRFIFRTFWLIMAPLINPTKYIVLPRIDFL